MNRYTVEAIWDEEARVWVATSEQIPGLATEGDTVEALAEKLKIMIPELLECGGQPAAPIPFELHTHRQEIAMAS